jgi:O-antigen ligase
MNTVGTLGLRDWRTAGLAGLVATCTVVAFAAVAWPWVVSGVVFGALLLVIVIVEPLALVAFMLAIGPADLSFMTGGFKSLFTEAGGLDMNGMRLIGVTGGFLLLFLVQRSMQRLAIGTYGRWYSIFLLWAAASIVTSIAPIDGLRLLLKLAYPFLTFLAVAGIVEREEQLDRLMAWTLVASLIIVAANPFFLLGFAYTVDNEGYRRLGGLGTYANPFSFYLLVILLISLGRFIVRGQSRYLILCALLGVWIYLSLTRITLLALLAGIATIVVYGALAQRHYRAVAGGVLVALMIAVPFLPPVLERSLGFVPTPGELKALLSSSPEVMFESINWQGRELLWPVVYNAFRADPMTGLGLGSSTLILRQTFAGTGLYVVHNEYLRLAAEVGLIGCGLFFLGVLGWWRAAWRSGWRGSSPQAREFALPALGTIVAGVFIALTDNSLDYYGPFTQYIGFLCGGALVAARLDAARRPGAAQSL